MPLTVDGISQKLGIPDQSEAVFKVCEHLAANPDHRIEKLKSASPALSTYRAH